MVIFLSFEVLEGARLETVLFLLRPGGLKMLLAV
jgi:hypothetical protein